MTEREGQAADDEIGICHVCGQTFLRQVELSKHLMDEHPDDVLPPVEAQQVVDSDPS
jgi:hypothetical protein